MLRVFLIIPAISLEFCHSIFNSTLCKLEISISDLKMKAYNLV